MSIALNISVVFFVFLSEVLSFKGLFLKGWVLRVCILCNFLLHMCSRYFSFFLLICLLPVFFSSVFLPAGPVLLGTLSTNIFRICVSTQTQPHFLGFGVVKLVLTVQVFKFEAAFLILSSNIYNFRGNANKHKNNPNFLCKADFSMLPNTPSLADC